MDVSHLSCGEEHTILVKVDNRINHHTFPVGNESGTAFFGSDNPGIPSVEHGKAKLAGQNLPNFDFFNYAGINRSVHIYMTPNEYIKDVTIIPFIEGNDGLVQYEVETVGKGTLFVEILDEEGNVVATAEGKKGAIRIKMRNSGIQNPDSLFIQS